MQPEKALQTEKANLSRSQEPCQLAPLPLSLVVRRHGRSCYAHQPFAPRQPFARPRENALA